MHTYGLELSQSIVNVRFPGNTVSTTPSNVLGKPFLPQPAREGVGGEVEKCSEKCVSIIYGVPRSSNLPREGPGLPSIFPEAPEEIPSENSISSALKPHQKGLSCVSLVRSHFSPRKTHQPATSRTLPHPAEEERKTRNRAKMKYRG